ncbi:hypothetical protein D3C77_481830 [compost metagenome]
MEQCLDGKLRRRLCLPARHQDRPGRYRVLHSLKSLAERCCAQTIEQQVAAPERQARHAAVVAQEDKTQVAAGDVLERPEICVRTLRYAAHQYAAADEGRTSAHALFRRVGEACIEPLRRAGAFLRVHRRKAGAQRQHTAQSQDAHVRAPHLSCCTAGS